MWQDALSPPQPMGQAPLRPLPFGFAGQALLACPSGALIWPAIRTLVVADLHLEKASAFARSGQLLPPYDSRATLDQLAAVLAAYAPETVVCLGDSFHDRSAGSRWDAADRTRLVALMAERRWIWVLGNHDPELPTGLGGERVEAIALEGVSLRHEAVPGAVGEMSGHYHPKVGLPGRPGRRRCFALGQGKLILPAFGAFAGGLDLRDPVFRPLLGARVTALALGRSGILPLKLAL